MFSVQNVLHNVKYLMSNALQKFGTDLRPTARGPVEVLVEKSYKKYFKNI